MTVYVLCSYSDGLNDPVISMDYQDLYKRMEKSYRMVLDHMPQTEEEKENTYLDSFRAAAVVHSGWSEWSITKLELPNSSDQIDINI